MTKDLPPLIDRFVAAVNRGNTEAFLACFLADGVVDDWGRRFTGHEAIRAWSDDEMIGAKGRMTVNGVEEAGNEVTVTAGWKSNFYSGPSRYVFIVDGDHIREMRITAA
jgi:hypothetical protein